MSADGLVTIESKGSFKETLSRLEAALAAKGLTVFARVDHAAGAAEVGMALRPTFLLLFGNPKGGTPLMQADQAAGIDLPLKALVWQGGEGTVFVSYNDPAWIAERHHLGAGIAKPVEAMRALLGNLAKEAAGI